MLPNRIRSLVAVIALVACTGVFTASAGPRPLSDFLNTQGSTNIFVPPVPDFIGWISALANPPLNFASVDYAGLAAAWLQQNGGPSLGTQVSGSVNERALPDGRAEVNVNLDFSNALTWVFVFDPNEPIEQVATAPLIFGYRAQDLTANPALTPGLSTGKLQAKFNNTAPGAPLPDLIAFIIGTAAPGQELLSIKFRSDGLGPLRAPFGVADGTPGKCVVSQTGLFTTAFKGATGDGFPAEKVDVKIGN